MNNLPIEALTALFCRKQLAMQSNQPLNILLVEDDPLDRLAIQRRVEETDFPCQLTTASSCKEAFSCLQDAQFDIILLDYQLGDGTGLEVLTEVDDTPVIFITGQGSEAVAVEALQQGAYDYLIKDVARDYLSILLQTIQNVVASKQTEEQLRLTQFALDHAANSIYWIREDSRIFYTNDAACQSLGYSRDELLSLSVSDIDPDFPTEGWPAQWEELKNCERLTFESHHKTKDGRVFPVEITTSYLTKGPDEFVWAYVHDITERKRVEEALRDAEMKSRSLLEGLPVCIKVIDLNSRLQYMSAAGLKQLKISDIKPFYGCTYPPDFYPESMRLPLIAHLERAQAGEVSSVECPVLDTEGSVVWYHTTFVPARDNKGQIEYVIASSVDITQRKRAEKRLRQRELELAHVSRLSTLGEMVAGVAHELGQPLYAITNFSGACAEELTNAETIQIDHLREWVGEIEVAANQAGSIITHLRKFAKPSGGQRKPCSMGEIVSETIALLEFELRSYNVRVSIETEGDIGAHQVSADPVQIQQVLVNLVTNACDAMHDTETTHRNLMIHVSYADDRVKVSIQDEGTGVKDSDVARLFDTFFTTKNSGMGMGLGICKSIIENHKGRIWWTPNEPRGTTFHFELPLSQPVNDTQPVNGGTG